MHPTLFEIMDFKFQSFGFMVAMGFMAGLVLLHWTGPRAGLDSNRITALFIWILLSGIAGARILYVIIHHEYYLENPLEIFMIWRGGSVLYGGIILSTVAVFTYARSSSISLPNLADALTPCLLLGLSIGRIGCFLVGDCHGRQAPDDLPWAVSFPLIEGSSIPHELVYVPLHPTQIYMSLNALCIFWITLYIFMRPNIFKHRKFEGQVFLVGLCLYACTRMLLELYRGDDLERVRIGPLFTSQWISLCVLLAMPVLVLWVRHRGRASSME